MNEMVIAVQTTNIPTYQNKALQSATNKVLKIGETVRKCAFETAYIMAQVDKSECYKDDGFSSVHDWAMKTFGFKKSASYSLLRVGKEYVRVISDAKGKVRGYGSNLLPEDSNIDFSTTQIEKMLPGGHEMAMELVESEEITPDMTCKEIEKVVQSYLKPEQESEQEQGPESDDYVSAEDRERCYVRVVDEGGNEYDVPWDVLEQYKI